MESTIENEFNKYINKNFYVNPSNDIVIKGIMPRLILSEEEQNQLIKEIHNLTIKKSLGEDVTLLEKLSLSFIFEGTY